MVLSQVKPGHTVKIMEVPPGKIRSQVIRFGIGVGSTVVVSQVLPGGPVVLRKGRQEIAMGRRLADSIKVKVLFSRASFKEGAVHHAVS